ncbi:MAG: PEP-CTERM sorting domain-containing protein [Burkholderiaceae bacterium]|nr:PEP-CTERM sorting domain-containing protein [Burkholderiaceae bacterium]
MLLRIENGLLTGAGGALVNGTLYDVSFQDGSCNSLQAGCTQFTFSTLLDAVAAGQALMDQVFVGVYDAAPELTRGCSSTRQCLITTIFGAGSTLADNAVTFNNRPADADDLTTVGLIGSAFDTTPNIDVTIAVWTAAAPGRVPEPSTLGLSIAALVALALVRRGHNRVR